MTRAAIVQALCECGIQGPALPPPLLRLLHLNLILGTISVSVFVLALMLSHVFADVVHKLLRGLRAFSPSPCRSYIWPHKVEGFRNHSSHGFLPEA